MIMSLERAMRILREVVGTDDNAQVSITIDDRGLTIAPAPTVFLPGFNAADLERLVAEQAPTEGV